MSPKRLGSARQAYYYLNMKNEAEKGGAQMRAWYFEANKAVVKNSAGRELARLTQAGDTWSDEAGNSFADLAAAEAYYTQYEVAVAEALAKMASKKA
jgi:hypothetical protein